MININIIALEIQMYFSSNYFSEYYYYYYYYYFYFFYFNYYYYCLSKIINSLKTLLHFFTQVNND